MKLLWIFSIIFLFGAISATTAIGACDFAACGSPGCQITTPSETYQLFLPITTTLGGGETCLTINAPNVALDLNGNSITAVSPGDVGIESRQDGAFIQNGTINAQRDITLTSRSNNVSLMTLSVIGDYGVYIDNPSSQNFVADNTITDTSGGTAVVPIYFNGAMNNIAIRNTISSGGTCIQLAGNAMNNNVSNNLMTSCATGIFADGPSNNNEGHFENITASTYWIDDYGTSNSWNKGAYYFTNGSGSWKTYNATASPASFPYADGGSDVPYVASNVGGTILEFKGNAVDANPFTQTHAPSVCSNIDLTNTPFTLFSNVSFTGDGACFNLTDTATELQCNGFSIIGDGSSTSTAIYMSGINKPQVLNCNAENVGIGVHSDSTTNGVIQNGNFTVVGVGNHALHVSSTSNLRITDVFANSTDNGGIGIYLASSTGNSIQYASAHGDNGGTGIYLDSQSIGNSISNSNASGFFYGVTVAALSDNNTISGVNASGDIGYGVDSSTGNTIANSTIGTVNDAIVITGSTNTKILNNSVPYSIFGIFLSFSHNSTIMNNTAAGTNALIFLSSRENNVSGNNLAGTTAIYTYGTSYLNNFTDNRLNGVAGFNPVMDASHSTFDFQRNSINVSGIAAFFSGNSSVDSNFLNNTVQGATWISDDNSINNMSILLNNSVMGNSYYFVNGTPAYTQFNYLDTNNDGWGDAGPALPFSKATVGDPPWDSSLTDGHPATPYSVNTLQCGVVLNTPNTVYNLTQDLYAANGTCFSISATATNITINCGNFAIIGNTSIFNYAIYSQAQQTTIENCNIHDFANGIWLHASRNSNLINDTLNTTTNNVLSDSSSNNVGMTRLHAYSYSGMGIQLQSVNDNNVTSSVVEAMNPSAAGQGVYASNSPNSVVSSCDIEGFGGGLGGIEFMSSSNGIISNNTVNTRKNGGNAVEFNGGSVRNHVFNNTLFTQTDCCTFAGGSSSTNALIENNIIILNSTFFPAAAIYLTNFAGGDVIRSNLIENTVPGSNAMWINIGTSNNIVYNNTFITNNGVDLQFSLSAGNNSIYLNNFTDTNFAYIIDLNGSNTYDAMLNGTNTGNYWANVMSGAVPIYDFNGDHWADPQSINMPYNSTTSLGLLSGNVVDYAPYTPFEAPAPNATSVLLALVGNNLIGTATVQAATANGTGLGEWYLGGINQTNMSFTFNWTNGVNAQVTTQLAAIGTWFFRVNAFDGYNYSNWTQSNALLIAPVPVGGSGTPNYCYGNDTNCSTSFTATNVTAPNITVSVTGCASATFLGVQLTFAQNKVQGDITVGDCIVGFLGILFVIGLLVADSQNGFVNKLWLIALILLIIALILLMPCLGWFG